MLAGEALTARTVARDVRAALPGVTDRQHLRPDRGHRLRDRLVRQPARGATGTRRSAGRSPTPGRTCWTRPAAGAARACPASCAWAAPAWPAATSTGPGLTADRFVADPFGRPGAPDVPHRRRRALDRRRRAGLPGPRRPPGEDPRLPHRAGRGRERAAAPHPEVADAVVVVREDDGHKRLVGYVVARRRGPACGRTWAGRCPSTWCRSAFVRLDQLPLNPNGKLDRAALPAPDWESHGTDHVAPRTDAERVAGRHLGRACWARPGRRRGQLLRAGRRLDPEHPGRVRGGQGRAHGVVARTSSCTRPSPALADRSWRWPSAVVERGPAPGEVPLTPVQHWFLDTNPAARSTSTSALVRSTEPATSTKPALRAALSALVDHHDALRLRFSATDGGGTPTTRAPSTDARRRGSR